MNRPESRSPDKTRRRQKREPIVVGYAERVDLPDFGISRLKAKMDTGAASSALHVTNLKELPDNRVRFDIVRHEDKEHLHVPVECEISRIDYVKPSSGKRQRRYFIKTRLTLGGLTRTVEVSLAKRSTMRFRMLIGRAALKGFLVNPEHRYLLDGAKKQKKAAASSKPSSPTPTGEDRTATSAGEDRTATS